MPWVRPTTVKTSLPSGTRSPSSRAQGSGRQSSRNAPWPSGRPANSGSHSPLSSGQSRPCTNMRKRLAPMLALDRVRDKRLRALHARHGRQPKLQLGGDARDFRKRPPRALLHHPQVRADLVHQLRGLEHQPLIDARPCPAPASAAGRCPPPSATKRPTLCRMSWAARFIAQPWERRSRAVPCRQRLLGFARLADHLPRRDSPSATSASLQPAQPKLHLAPHGCAPFAPQRRLACRRATTRIAAATSARIPSRPVSINTSARCPTVQFFGNVFTRTSTRNSRVSRSVSRPSRATSPGYDFAGSERNTTRAGWPDRQAAPSPSRPPTPTPRSHWSR